MARKNPEDKLIIHRWEAEDIQDALRALNNYLHFHKCGSCNHRDLTGAYNTINNILNGKPNTVASRYEINTEYSIEK